MLLPGPECILLRRSFRRRCSRVGRESPGYPRWPPANGVFPLANRMLRGCPRLPSARVVLLPAATSPAGVLRPSKTHFSAPLRCSHPSDSAENACPVWQRYRNGRSSLMRHTTPPQSGARQARPMTELLEVAGRSSSRQGDFRFQRNLLAFVHADSFTRIVCQRADDGCGDAFERHNPVR